MRVLSIRELMRLTRIEPTDLYVRPDHQRPAGHAGRLCESANRAHEPAQHPHGAGTARSDAVTTRKTLPVRTGRVVSN
jgi:hypothetical protein